MRALIIFLVAVGLGAGCSSAAPGSGFPGEGDSYDSGNPRDSGNPWEPAVVSIALSPERMDLLRGESSSLEVIASYADGSKGGLLARDVEWLTSAADVAGVSGGHVSAVGEGQATLTASYAGRSAHAEVTVNDRHRAFLTSATGSGDLSKWADAGGKVGLAAADAVCQASAERVGLRGTFVAWMSDPEDDAYCRIHGLHGRIADRCGLEQLPIDAGPWVRMDGSPYAPKADKLVAGEIYAPVRFDEKGKEEEFVVALSATSPQGALDTKYSSCVGWTSDQTGQALSCGSSNSRCLVLAKCNDTNRRLMCLEAGAGLPLPSFATQGKLVFVTSAAGPGKLSDQAWGVEVGDNAGIAAGDAICQTLAAAASVPRATKFKAWLATYDPSTEKVTTSVGRFTSNGPWVRTDGVKVATKADLAIGRISAPISITEEGDRLEILDETIWVWTGAFYNGWASTNSECKGWTSNAESDTGSTGEAISSSSMWSARTGGDGLADRCNSTRRLYCFEDD